MPNLIHSLDATSLMLLCEKFMSMYKIVSIYTIHDCFFTTCDKVNNLLIILRSVYTKLYYEEPCLRNFDKCIINNILSSYGNQVTWNEEERTFTSIDKDNKENKYILHYVDWVYGRKTVVNTRITKINRQKFNFNNDV